MVRVSLSLPHTDESEAGSVESVWLSHFSSEGSLSGGDSLEFFWKRCGEFQRCLGRLSLASSGTIPTSV